MKILRLLTLWSCVVFLAAGCSRQTGSSAAPPPHTARAATLKVELASPDATDIARVIAIDNLRTQGYKVDTVTFGDNSLLFVGMQKGDVDLAAVADVTGWNAIHHGAPAFVLMDESAMTILVLAADDVRTCADLDGKTVGTGAIGGAYSTLMRAYVEKNCPSATPRYIAIPRAPNKLAALLSGQVAAIPVELYDYLELAPEQASRVHPLTWFADEFPGLTSISLFMRRGLATEYPETARDVVRAILQARRRIQDPDVLTNELITRLGLDPVKARTTAEAFLRRKVWNVNGLTLESLQRNIDFYRRENILPPGLAARDVADLSYLNSVLDEIGRK